MRIMLRVSTEMNVNPEHYDLAPDCTTENMIEELQRGINAGEWSPLEYLEMTDKSVNTTFEEIV